MPQLECHTCFTGVLRAVSNDLHWYPNHMWVSQIVTVRSETVTDMRQQYLPAATKLGQGNIFTSVCQEFCPRGEGVCLSACWDTPPRADTPGSRHPPGADTLPEQTPREQTPPRSRTPPTGSRHPRSRHPPGKQTAAYGQRAAGTHPTGMHSCLKECLHPRALHTHSQTSLDGQISLHTCGEGFVAIFSKWTHALWITTRTGRRYCVRSASLLLPHPAGAEHRTQTLLTGYRATPVTLEHIETKIARILSHTFRHFQKKN